LATTQIRLLLVEDHEDFRKVISSILQRHSGLHIIRELADGLEAVREAEKLQPDLILLDIGLPRLNGIEAARRIRKVAPDSKILFLSVLFSPDVVQEALNLGARGYVVKADAGNELRAAVAAVIEGNQYVSSAADHVVRNVRTSGQFSSEDVVASLAPVIQKPEIVRGHPVQFYSDEASFLDDFTCFITNSLNAQNMVIVLATESHRTSLYQSLQARGVDMVAAVEQKRYIPLDVDDSSQTFIVDGAPDPVHCAKSAGNLIVEAAKAAAEMHLHVAVG
jgi:DNA-binding NarL/FixJ family response regulator